MNQEWIGRIVFHPEYGIGKVIGYDSPFYNIYLYKAIKSFIFDESRHIFWAWPREVENMLISVDTLRCLIRRRQCK